MHFKVTLFLEDNMWPSVSVSLYWQSFLTVAEPKSNFLVWGITSTSAKIVIEGFKDKTVFFGHQMWNWWQLGELEFETEQFVWDMLIDIMRGKLGLDMLLNSTFLRM